MDQQICVVGMGMFGFVLSRYLALKYPEKKILVYDKQKNVIESLLEARKHPVHFQAYSIPKNIIPTNDLERAMGVSDIVVLCVPTQMMRNAARDFGVYVEKDAVLLNVAKGLEVGSGKRVSQILREELHTDYCYAVLSGGTIAEEMIREDPLAAEIACTCERVAKQLQEIFATPQLRVYRNEDVTGVEIAGALKNPLSIASGIAHGLGFGSSTISALVSRGSLEIKRLALSLGAKEKTFDFGGQAGMGDIMTSCFGNTRNRRFGELVVKENSVEEALCTMRKEEKLVEGYFTSRALHRCALNSGIEMPIQDQVVQILYKGKEPKAALEELMSRTLKSL